MGFDLYIYDDKYQELGYFRSYMGGFRMVREEVGYDWFDLIDAYDCYGGVSGNGQDKMIKLKDLEKARKDLLKISSVGTHEWAYRKPLLDKFMRIAIKYCRDNKLEEVKFGFY